MLERLSSSVPFLLLFRRQKARSTRHRCDSKTNFRLALQSFAMYCALPSALVPGGYLTFQRKPTFGFETARGEPKVDVSLGTQWRSPTGSTLQFSEDMSPGPTDELRQMVRRWVLE
jgi:hypothetical protein